MPSYVLILEYVARTHCFDLMECVAWTDWAKCIL